MMATMILIAAIAVTFVLAALFGEDTRDGRDWQARVNWPPHGR